MLKKFVMKHSDLENMVCFLEYAKASGTLHMVGTPQMDIQTTLVTCRMGRKFGYTL